MPLAEHDVTNIFAVDEEPRALAAIFEILAVRLEPRCAGGNDGWQSRGGRFAAPALEIALGEVVSGVSNPNSR
jgi:hypothetical protein